MIQFSINRIKSPGSFYALDREGLVLYSVNMDAKLDRIREVLEREIPEIRTGDGFGVLCGFILSFIVTSLLGIGTYVLITFRFGRIPHPLGIFVSAAAALLFGFWSGWRNRDSTEIAGADMLDSGVKRYDNERHSIIGNRFEYERAQHEMTTGAAVFITSFIFGGLYATYAYLKKRGTLEDNNSSRIASGIVALLLEDLTPQDKLEKTLEEQGVQPEETRNVLAILTKAGIVEANSERMWISPTKKYIFDTVG